MKKNVPQKQVDLIKSIYCLLCHQSQCQAGFNKQWVFLSSCPSGFITLALIWQKNNQNWCHEKLFNFYTQTRHTTQHLHKPQGPQHLLISN